MMRIICVDDEPRAVDCTVRQCEQLPQVDEVTGFADAQEALDHLEAHSVDLAILEINMAGIDGIDLAARIKELCPQAAILFLTACKEYAFDAFAVHPAGYLLKPVSQERLAAEVAYVAKASATPARAHILVSTFGYFDVYVDGAPVSFKLARAKEILAFLVDKQGAGITRRELFAGVWEDRPYDRRMQKQLDVYIRSLFETLREYGASEIVEMQRGVLRVRPDTFTCDAYRFYAGDAEAVSAYRGEYMRSYAWASMTESALFWHAQRDG